MFGQVLDKLDTWFGRAFLLSRYFPCLLFVTTNAVIAYASFATLRPPIDNAIANANSPTLVIYLVAALAAIGVFAYVISPFGLFVTRLLEGDFLGPNSAAFFAFGETRRLNCLAERLRESFERRASLPEPRVVNRRLAEIRRQGARHAAITNPGAIRRAEKAIRRLNAKVYLRRPIQFGELVTGIESLSEALRENCADVGLLRVPVRLEDHRCAERLAKVHREFSRQIVYYAKETAEDIEASAFDAREQLFAKVLLKPTRLGNEAAALRDYCKTRYGIEFDFFWPRFQLAIQKNDKLSSAIVTAKIQLDFAIFSLVLTTVAAVAWFVIFALIGHRIPLLAALVLGPPTVALWLQVVHASYAGFAEVVRSSIDIGRFELLQALHQPLPVTTEAEKQMWERLANLVCFASHQHNLTFKHPST